jgi:hypothetical protein
MERSHTARDEKITPQGTPLLAIAVSRCSGKSASS